MGSGHGQCQVLVLAVMWKWVGKDETQKHKDHSEASCSKLDKKCDENKTVDFRYTQIGGVDWGI